MALQPLKIIKTWFARNVLTPEMLDEIANKVISYSSRTNLNLKQLGLDINGASYEFSNDGRATQTSPIVTRLDALSLNQPGFRNLALDLTAAGTVTIAAGDGSALTSSNGGTAFFTDVSSGNEGELVSRSVTSNISLTLTGAHWGFGTAGNLFDEPLFIYLIDNGSSVVLGVSRTQGLDYVQSANCETVNTSVTTRAKIFTSTAISSDATCIPLGYVKFDFVDTGDPSGEDYWTQQTDSPDKYQLFPSSRYIESDEIIIPTSGVMDADNGTIKF